VLGLTKSLSPFSLYAEVIFSLKLFMEKEVTQAFLEVLEIAVARGSAKFVKGKGFYCSNINQS